MEQKSKFKSRKFWLSVFILLESSFFLFTGKLTGWQWIGISLPALIVFEVVEVIQKYSYRDK